MGNKKKDPIDKVYASIRNSLAVLVIIAISGVMTIGFGMLWLMFVHPSNIMELTNLRISAIALGSIFIAFICAGIALYMIIIYHKGE